MPDTAPMTLERLLELIVDAFTPHIAALAERLRALEARAAVPGPPGEPGAPGATGVAGNGIQDLFIDQDGILIATMTDGSTRTAGRVVGRDGRNVDMAEVEAAIAERVAAIPPPKDGKDGFGFDDMTEELAEDGRTVVRRYQRGDQLKEFRHTFAVVLDRGVFRDGQTYQAGDGVTWAGSWWIAQEATGEKPDSGKGWRLAVKRGRDGKNGKDGDRGPEGKPGKNGSGGNGSGEPGAGQW